MNPTRRVVLLAIILAVSTLGGCELSLRAGQPCPCASTWICCADSQVCVRDQAERAAYHDGGAPDTVAPDDGPIGYADATVTILAATGRYGLTDITFDETHVYWMESGMSVPDDYDARVMRVVKTGGTPEVVVTLAPRAYRFTLDATHVYVAHQNFGQGGPGEGVGAIVRAPKAGGAPETVLGGLSYPYAIDLDDQYVYFSTGDGYNGVVVRVPKGGGAATTLVDQVYNPWDVAVDDTHVYYSEMNKSRMMKVAKTGGTPVELASGWVGTNKLSLDASTVYFTVCPTGPCESQTIYSVAKTGGDARLIASLSTAAGDGDVVARSRLYWGGRQAGPNDQALGVIYALPKGGGEPFVLATGLQMPVELAVEPDESAAYWVDALTGDVGRLQLR